MFTDKDKAECAEREVKQRRYVYPRRVADGKMTQALADRQIAIMEAIAADYRAKADAEDAKGRLF
jgi:hypothetical protein